MPRRGTILLLLLLGILLASRAAGSREEGFRRTALQAFRPKEPLLRCYEPPHGTQPAEEPPCVRGKVGRHRLILVDLNGDGRFDEEGVDAWTLGGHTHMVPQEPPLILGSQRLHVRIEEDGRYLAYRLEPREASDTILRGLEILNARRMMNGLVPVDLDDLASKHCALHARYLHRNNLQGHAEDPDLPGYTAEGAKAGRKSSIGGGEDLAGMADRIYRQFFHRFSAMDPDVGAFGLAAESGYSLVDGDTVRSRRPWPYPVLVPAPGSRGQPREFATSERPLPFSPDLTPGLPITLRFRLGESPALKEARLLQLGRKSRELEILTSWPDHPAVPAFPHNFYAICIIPRVPLAADTSYEVYVSWTLGGVAHERTWIFTTASK